MKSIGLLKSLPIEHPEALFEKEVPAPSPMSDDLLVRVDAISVNPADVRVRKRKLDDGDYTILGWDVAGTVISAGDNVSNFQPGDKVFYAGDIKRPGANSELHVVHAAIVGHAPKTLPTEQAAALPLTALTAWEALFERLKLSPERKATGQTLLIVGGAGGVGSIAIQLASLVPELTIIATASRPQSAEWCKQMGAHHVINHAEDMAQQFAALKLQAPDMILLTNEPDAHFPNLAELIAPQGNICSIVPFVTPPDINLLMQKSAGLLWEFMFTRASFSTADMANQGKILNRIAQLIDTQKITSTVSNSFGKITADNLRKAHQQIETGRTIGKITLCGF